MWVMLMSHSYSISVTLPEMTRKKIKTEDKG